MTARYYYPDNVVLEPKWTYVGDSKNESPKWPWILGAVALLLILLAFLFWWMFKKPILDAKEATVVIVVDKNNDGHYASDEISGSGVLISRDGHVLTNKHILLDADGHPIKKLQVWINSGKPNQRQVQDATTTPLMGTGDIDDTQANLKNDWAVIQFAGKDTPSVALSDKTDFKEGDPVAAIGFPNTKEALSNPNGPSVDAEICKVTSVGLSPQGAAERLVIDSKSTSGSSGGPVVDRRGRLIGLVTGAANENDMNRETSVLPVNLIRRYIDNVAKP